jgi:hypothetical protein
LRYIHIHAASPPLQIRYNIIIGDRGERGNRGRRKEMGNKTVPSAPHSSFQRRLESNMETANILAIWLDFLLSWCRRTCIIMIKKKLERVINWRLENSCSLL